MKQFIKNQIKKFKKPLPMWQGVYSSFDEIGNVTNGFAGERWLEKQKQSALKGEPTDNGNLSLLVATFNTDVAVLDYGGGLGIEYYRVLNTTGKQIQPYIVENKDVVDFGNLNMPFTFSTEVPKDFNPDIVYLGSSIQYISDWKIKLTELTSLGAEYLLINDVACTTDKTFATVQNYNNSRIPYWFFNLDELIDNVHGYTLVSKTVYRNNVCPELSVNHSYNLLFKSRNPNKQKITI
jgi:putative methyltransferase (TIGR04325 family)